MGQGMAGGWLIADTIRRSTNMPKLPVFDGAVDVEARGAATYHLLPRDSEQMHGRVKKRLL
jgi:hypothetical protein